MYPVAVYGTLRRGHGNHTFLRNATYQGRKVLEGYNMFMLGSVVPGIKEGDGSVVVETYTDYDLEPLDRLEGHPTFYERTVVDIEGQPHYVYVYQHKVDGDKQVQSGDYNDQHPLNV